MSDLQFACLLCCFASTTLALVEKLVKRLNASEGEWEQALVGAGLARPVGGRRENRPSVTYTDKVSAYPVKLLERVPDRCKCGGLYVGGYCTWCAVPFRVSPVTRPVSVTPPGVTPLSGYVGTFPPVLETLDGSNGKETVSLERGLATAVATTPNEADETSPEKSRGEKSGSHVGHSTGFGAERKSGG